MCVCARGMCYDALNVCVATDVMSKTSMASGGRIGIGLLSLALALLRSDHCV